MYLSTGYTFFKWARVRLNFSGQWAGHRPENRPHKYITGSGPENLSPAVCTVNASYIFALWKNIIMVISLSYKSNPVMSGAHLFFWARLSSMQVHPSMDSDLVKLFTYY